MQEGQGASRNLYGEQLGNDSEQERLYIHENNGRGEAGKRAVADFIEPRAGIFKKSMGARHRVGIGLLYWPARLHRLAEFIPWN
jgi:hypothetical protein